jgi:hypothetical protein
MPWLPYESEDRVIINSHNFTPANWTPAQISTAVWLDASDAATLYDAVSGGSAVAANGAVARWQDKSGNGRHVTQSTIGARPARKTNVQNGLDAVLFDGNDWLQNLSAGALPNRPKTIVALVKSSDAVGGTIWQNRRPENSGFRYLLRLLRLGGISYVAGDTTTSNVTISNDFSSAFQSPFLVSQTVNASGVVSHWGNGTSQSTSGTIGTEDTITGFFIGILNSIQAWNGHMMEIVAIDSEVSTETRQLTEGYLAHKWGTTSSLDASHPYKSVAP